MDFMRIKAKSKLQLQWNKIFHLATKLILYQKIDVKDVYCDIDLYTNTKNYNQAIDYLNH